MEFVSESEAVRIAVALEAGALEAFDNRSDGIADSDPLCDAQRVGQRIADGFALLDNEGEF